MATPQESPSRLQKAGTTTAIIWVALSTWRSCPAVRCASGTISLGRSIASGTTAGEPLMGMMALGAGGHHAFRHPTSARKDSDSYGSQDDTAGALLVRAGLSSRSKRRRGWRFKGRSCEGADVPGVPWP